MLARVQSFLFPLTLLAFLGVQVNHVSTVFNSTTRWVPLALLALSILGSRRWYAPLTTGPGLVIIFYCAWCLLTVNWSQALELTALKAIAQILTIVALVCAGGLWVGRSPPAHSLNYLLPVAALALFAGVAGMGAADSIGGNPQLELYQGLTENPNALGALIAMAMPYALWQCYRCRRAGGRRLLAWAMTAMLIYLLAASVSRSSIAAVVFTGAGMLLGFGLRKQVLIGLLLVASLLAAVVVAPDIIEKTHERYVLKARAEGGDVLATRRDVWRESYELAKKGGWFGAGFGVTIGADGFAGGLSAAGYGREKGNSQLAVWEETGLVGLGLYAAFLLSLAFAARSALRMAKDRGARILYGTILGALSGLLFQSVFEAWWTAPGSPEATWFWALVGVALGLRRQLLAQRVRYPADPMRSNFAPRAVGLSGVGPRPAISLPPNRGRGDPRSRPSPAR